MHPYNTSITRSRGSLTVNSRQASSSAMAATDSGLVGATKAYGGGGNTTDVRRPTLYQSRRGLPYRRQRTTEERSAYGVNNEDTNYHHLSRTSSLNALQSSNVSRPRTSSGGSSGSSGAGGGGSGVRGSQAHRGKRPITPNTPGTRGSLSVYARQMSAPRRESRW